MQCNSLMIGFAWTWLFLTSFPIVWNVGMVLEVGLRCHMLRLCLGGPELSADGHGSGDRQGHAAE